MPDMAFISWIIVGLVVGLLAKAILKQAYPIWLTIVLGILGAALGGVIVGLLGMEGGWGLWNPMQWLFSTLGAVIVMAVVGALGRRRT